MKETLAEILTLAKQSGESNLLYELACVMEKEARIVREASDLLQFLYEGLDKTSEFGKGRMITLSEERLNTLLTLLTIALEKAAESHIDLDQMADEPSLFSRQTKEKAQVSVGALTWAQVQIAGNGDRHSFFEEESA